MNLDLFFKEEKWLPSFSFIANNEIIYHFPAGKPNQNSRVQSIAINKGYAAQKTLCENVITSIYKMNKELKKKSQNTLQNLEQIRLKYLKQITQQVVIDADQNGMKVEHKLLYLIWKFLSLLISSQSKNQVSTNKDKISLKQWLLDIHALFYHKNQQRIEILELLKWCSYQQLLLKLREVRNQAGNEKIESKIDFTISLLWTKMNSFQLQQRISGQNMQVQPTHMKDFKQKCIQTFKDKKGSTDIYEAICQVLVGNNQFITKISQQSWPLILLHRLQASSEITSVAQVASVLLKQQHELKPQLQMLLSLPAGHFIHKTYQQLFNFTNPFLCHLTAFLFHKFRYGFTLVNLLQQDYINQVIRNLFDHAAKVSFKTLILTYATLQGTEYIDKFPEIIQPLLLPYLTILDLGDKQQIGQFIKKINLLKKIHLNYLAINHLRTAFNLLMRSHALNEQIKNVYNLLINIDNHNKKEYQQQFQQYLYDEQSQKQKVAYRM